MNWRQIESSREIRLWLTQVVLPAVTIVMLVPEARNAIIDKTKRVKESIKTKFTNK